MPVSLVIGSGLIGICTAYYLRQSGDHVIVLDQQPGVALGASHANGCHLCPSHTMPWATPSGLGRLLRMTLPSFSSGVIPADPQEREAYLKSVASRFKSLRGDSSLAHLRWMGRFASAALCGQEDIRRRTKALFELACKSRDLSLSVASQHRFYEKVGFRQSALVLYQTDASFRQAKEKALWMKQMGADVEVLIDIFQILAVESSLRNSPLKIVGATYSRDDWTGDSRVFCQSLAEVCKEQGVVFQFSSSPISATFQSDASGRQRVMSVQTSEGVDLQVDRVFICAGVGSPDLLRNIFHSNYPLHIQPVKGYSLTLPPIQSSSSSTTTSSSSSTLLEFKRGLVLGETNTYLAQLPDGSIRITNGTDFSGFDSTPSDPDRKAWLELVATHYLGYPPPDSSQSPLLYWAGLRPASPHGLPYIGLVPQFQNLYVNSGHGSLGWTLAVASGRLCTEIANESFYPIVDPKNFQL